MRLARHAVADAGRRALTLTAAELRQRGLRRVSIALPLRSRAELDAAVALLGSPGVGNADRAVIAREVLAYLDDHRAAVASLVSQAQESARCGVGGPG